VSIVKIPVRRITACEAQRGHTLPWLDLQVTMTEDQMYQALNSMLTNISGETWSKWVDRINQECFGEVAA